MENDPGKHPVFYSLKTRMLVSFSLLLFIALGSVELAYIYGVPFTDHGGEFKEHQTDAFRDLNLIADLKKERMLRWIEERKDDSMVFAQSVMHNRQIKRLVSLLHAETSRGLSVKEIEDRIRITGEYKELLAHLNLVMRAYGVYEELEIADLSTGTVIVSTSEEHLGRNISEEKYISDIPRTGEVYFRFVQEISPTERAYHRSDSPLHISRLIMLKDKPARAVAIFVMHIEPDDFIEPLLHTGGGLGSTGEALLVNHDVRILTELKHKLGDGTIAEPLVYEINAKPAILAAKGQEGTIAAKDYRGVPVLAAYRYLSISPEVGWGLVVKKDRSEIFAPLRESVLYSSLIGCVAIICSLFIAYVIANSLSRPVQSLSNAARRIEEGDFDARADTSSSGEIGILAESFNTMADKIQHWHTELETEVELRTHELLAENEERRRAQAKVRKSDQRFRVALSGSKITVFTQDRLLKYTWVYNPNPELSPEAVIGKTDHDLVPADDALALTKLKRRVLETGIAEHETIRFTVEGKPSFYDISIEPMLDSKGRTTGIIGVSTDITERKQAQELLEQKSRHIQQFLDALPCFAMILNSNREIVALNSIARQMNGDIGKQCFRTLGQSNSPCPWCRADVALQSNEFQHLQTWGLDIFWDAYWIPLEKDLYLHFAFDITDRKRAEEKIQHSLKEKGVLLAEIHHRVKNNMAVIYSLLDLQSAQHADEVLTSHIKASQNRIMSMALIHEKLYQTSDFTSIDLDDYVRSLTEKLIASYSLDVNNINATFDVDDIHLSIDELVPSGLIINELVTNAIKYAFDGIEEPQVHVAVKDKGPGSYLLSVSDNGIGMGVTGNLGDSDTLGLKIVNILSNQLNGKIEIDTSGGTSISVLCTQRNPEET